MKLFTQEEIVGRIKEVYGIEEFDTFRVHRTSDNKCLYSGMAFVLTDEGIKHIDSNGNYHDNNQVFIIIANIISGDQYLKKCEFDYKISLKTLAKITDVSEEEINKSFQAWVKLGNKLASAPNLEFISNEPVSTMFQKKQ